MHESFSAGKVFGLSTVGGMIVANAVVLLNGASRSCKRLADGVWVDCVNKTPEGCRAEGMGFDPTTGEIQIPPVVCSDPLLGSVGTANLIGTGIAIAFGLICALLASLTQKPHPAS